MEIRDIVGAPDEELGRQLNAVLVVSQDQHALVQSMSTDHASRLTSIEGNVDRISNQLDSRFNVLEARLSRPDPYRPSIPFELTEDMDHSVIQVRATVRQPCFRYCKCQCHRPSTINTPSWARFAIGSLVAQYNGVSVIGKNPCSSSACKSTGKGSLKLGYSFPRWMIGRAVSLSASWDTLTNTGAHLHLAVPRVNNLPGLPGAVMHRDLEWLKEKVASRQLLPTDIEDNGEGIFSVRVTPYSACNRF